jgi:hypothetical protein
MAQIMASGGPLSTGNELLGGKFLGHVTDSQLCECIPYIYIYIYINLVCYVVHVL